MLAVAVVVVIALRAVLVVAGVLIQLAVLVLERTMAAVSQETRVPMPVIIGVLIMAVIIHITTTVNLIAKLLILSARP